MIKLPSGVSKNNLISDLRSLSWEASEILLYYSKLLRDESIKSNILKNVDFDNPVTKADLKVNKIIIQRINEKYEGVNWEILSEENAKNADNFCKKNTDWLWILDPLDGTKDFIQDTGNYAMHLALNYRKRPLIGLVLIPERDELWITDGEKVWGEKKDGSLLTPKLSHKNDFNKMTIVTSKNHKNKVLKTLVEKIHFNEEITMGSIGCKIASIIRGESDIYISLNLPGKGSPKDWDFAAPEAILKAAGGKITTIENKELIYGEKDYEQGGILIASNDRLTHSSKCLRIKEIIRNYNICPIYN